jgi:hypothetical protein
MDDHVPFHVGTSAVKNMRGHRFFQIFEFRKSVSSLGIFCSFGDKAKAIQRGPGIY